MEPLLWAGTTIEVHLPSTPDGDESTLEWTYWHPWDAGDTIPTDHPRNASHFRNEQEAKDYWDEVFSSLTPNYPLMAWIHGPQRDCRASQIDGVRFITEYWPLPDVEDHIPNWVVEDD